MNAVMRDLSMDEIALNNMEIEVGKVVQCVSAAKMCPLLP